MHLLSVIFLNVEAKQKLNRFNKLNTHTRTKAMLFPLRSKLREGILMVYLRNNYALQKYDAVYWNF